MLDVPQSALDNHRTRAPWSGFGTVLTLYDVPASVDSIIADGEEYNKPMSVYSIEGRRVSKDTRGLAVVKGKKMMR